MGVVKDRALAKAVADAGGVGLPLGQVVEILWPEDLKAAFNPFGGMWRRVAKFVADQRGYELRARHGGRRWRALSAPLPDAMPQSWERSEFTIDSSRREVRLFQAGGGGEAAKPTTVAPTLAAIVVPAGISLPKSGPRRTVSAAVEKKMREALATEEITPDGLANLTKKELPKRFGGGETTCWKVRKAVLGEP